MRKLFNLFLALPLLMLAACSSDGGNDPEPSFSHTYTMTGSTGVMGSRVSYTDVSNTMYCRWEVGDVVTLRSSAGATYDFVVKSVDADGVGTMSYDGAIPGADSFTGTATYAPIDAAKACVQSANDSTSHLKYGERMVATPSGQKIDGASLTFTHPSTAVYKVTFKAPVAFAAGSKLTMSGAWTEDASLTLNFSAAKDAVVTAYIIHTSGSLASGGKLKFSLAVNGDTYSYTFTSQRAFSYEAGKYWLANISDRTMEKESSPIISGAVDLGLPSGIKWASCNLGASSPEEYGDYYGWGCTEPYKSTDNVGWSLYFQMIGGTGTSYSDCGTDKDPLKDYVYPNQKSIAGTKWDAARAKLGGTWRMPTTDEQRELVNSDNCTWTWTTQNGKNGYKVVSKKNGNSIFLPAAGLRYGTSLSYAGSDGYYWSSTPYGSYADYAFGMYFDSG